MAFQVNIFLLLFGGLQGVLLSVFLIRKKIYQTAYIYLLFYLGTMLMQITLKVMSKIWLMENWSVLYSLSHYLPLLYGPLLYFFVKHSLENTSFRLRELLHFFPFMLLFLSTSVGVHSSLKYEVESILFNPHFRMVLLIAGVCIYHTLAFRLWIRHRQNQHQYFSVLATPQLNWLKKLIVVSALVTLTIIVALYLLYINYPHGHQYRYGFVALSVFIYWFSYTALANPSFFSFIKGNAKEQHENVLQVPPLKAFRSHVKYSNSSLADEQVNNICAALENTMKEKKLYLQADLTIVQLAEELNCTRHHLSQILNNKLQKSYYDFINNLRIEEARHLLTQPEYQHYKIASIAYDAGFNSLSTFNEVFKKHTGQTPSEFRKELLKGSCQQRV